MDNKEKEVLLIIADISGYTKFMIDNKTTLIHAQTIITSLINSIIREAKIPLKVAKLEGDAVFLTAVKQNSAGWERRLADIRKHITAFFAAFKMRARELALSNTCECNACRMAEELKLKIVIHFGKALFYRVGGRSEISGADVILVHRLLKNSIDSSEYIALTGPAFTELKLKDVTAYEQVTENYDLGPVTLLVTYPAEKLKAVMEKINKKRYSSPFFKMAAGFSKMMTMLPFMIKDKTKDFHNLPEA